MNATENRALYLAWVRENFPTIYADVVGVAPLGPLQLAPLALSGFWDNVGSAFNSAVQNITQALPQLSQAYSQIRTQQDLLRYNSQRAQQGLPPLTMNAQGQLVTPTGLMYTEGEYNLARTGGLGTGGWLMIGAAGLLGLILLTRSSGSARR